MANPKPKGKTTTKINLTLYQNELDIINEEKTNSLDRNEIFNTSDFFRFCINDNVIKNRFHKNVIIDENSRPKGENAIRINLTLYKKELETLEEEKKNALDREKTFNTSDFFRFCVNDDLSKSRFYNNMRKEE